MAINPELVHELSYTKARIRTFNTGSTRIDIIVYIRNLCQQLRHVEIKIKQAAWVVVNHEWNIPIDTSRQNLTHRLISPVLKIPSHLDRTVNKRKTFLQSLK